MPKLSQEHLQGTEAQKDKKHRKKKGTENTPNSCRNICKEQKHKKIRNTKKERDRKHAKTRAGTSARNRSTKR